MSTKKSILEEALADSKQVKKAAMANAQKLILENFKEDLKEMVEDQINEMAGEEGGAEDESASLEGGDELDLGDLGGEEDLQLSESADEGESDSDGDDDDSSEEEGLTEADLSKAIAAALMEVDHGPMGEMEEIDPEGSHPTGLMDKDAKEDGWENKVTPNKKDFTVKENAYKARITKLVSENTILKKANETLKKTVSEMNLFNTKLHFAHKLLQKENLNVETKKQILKKFDKVQTVDEAKRLFESLELAISTMGGNRTVKKAVKPLSEALGITDKGEKANLNETAESRVLEDQNPFSVGRMQRLAGLGKK